jgi:hypothetical protein
MSIYGSLHKLIESIDETNYDIFNNNNNNNNNNFKYQKYISDYKQNNNKKNIDDREKNLKNKNTDKKKIYLRTKFINTNKYNLLYKYTERNLYKNINNPFNNICSISQKTFSDNDIIIKIKTCKHIFIEEEFLKWHNLHNTCPLCRSCIYK